MSKQLLQNGIGNDENRKLFEVTAAGFNGGDDKTDDLVFWVKAASGEEVKAAIEGTGALYHDAIDHEANTSIDFQLPTDLQKMRKKLEGYRDRKVVANSVMSKMNTDFRYLVNQYLHDPVGQRLWPAPAELAANDALAALRSIFLEGACFDFAATLSDLTGWPVYEILWGSATQDDPAECDYSKKWGVHRIVQHPSGRYLDASGWTDRDGVLDRVQCQNATYIWMGEVDPDGGPFDVNVDLVDQAVIALLPEDAGLLNLTMPEGPQPEGFSPSL